MYELCVPLWDLWRVKPEIFIKFMKLKLPKGLAYARRTTYLFAGTPRLRSRVRKLTRKAHASPDIEGHEPSCAQNLTEVRKNFDLSSITMVPQGLWACARRIPYLHSGFSTLWRMAGTFPPLCPLTRIWMIDFRTQSWSYQATYRWWMKSESNQLTDLSAERKLHPNT